MIEQALFACGPGEAGSEIAAAKKLIPILRERAPATEQAARLPDETIADLVEAGLLSLFKPRRHGGRQASFGTGIEVVRLLACGDASVAWVTAVTVANSLLFPVMFPPAAIAEVYKSPNVCLAGSSSKLKFKGRLVDGGLAVEEGVWGYNSGVYHAQWDLLSVGLVEGFPHPLAILAPTSELETLDDWRVTGLAGTGSTTVRLRDAFIPLDRIAMPGSQSVDKVDYRDDDALYRTDLALLGPCLLHSVVLGVARAALELFVKKVKGRRILYTQYSDQSLAPTTHYRVGEASAMLEAAEAAARCGIMYIEAAAAERRELSQAERFRISGSMAYASVLAKNVVNNLAEISGASVISQSSEFNRLWRNIHAATTHPVVTPSPAFEASGRVAFGLAPEYSPA